MSHVSNELKWPRMAYGQQSALFWAIVQNIKKLFAVRPIEQTCNHSPPIPPPTSLPWWIVIVTEWLKGVVRETVGGWKIASFIELGPTKGKMEVSLN